MRLAELSRTTGVPPATIKWYLREGLIRKGEATARNQAQYDESHVRRLRLIRALVDIGGLTTQEARDILAVVDDPNASIDQVVGAAHGALARVPDSDADPTTLAQVDHFLASRGWTVSTGSPARAELAGIVRAMTQLTPGDDHSDQALVAGLAPYANAIDQLAAAEVEELPHDVPRDVLVEQVVLGTVLAERLIGSLRRLAQESAFLARYVTPSDINR
jgi:DNA-binding transcriptional MerR regulator